jgi:hypothetical protein
MEPNKEKQKSKPRRNRKEKRRSRKKKLSSPFLRAPPLFGSAVPSHLLSFQTPGLHSHRTSRRVVRVSPLFSAPIPVDPSSRWSPVPEPPAGQPTPRPPVVGAAPPPTGAAPRPRPRRRSLRQPARAPSPVASTDLTSRATTRHRRSQPRGA